MYDTLFSIINLHTENDMSFSNYKNNYGSLSNSHLEIKELWHPSISRDKRVYNNLLLNDDIQKNVITGPNAAGKSTYVKSVLLNILLAQTITLCPSKELHITPFLFIHSMIQIPDIKGKQSLFEAEMYRCKENIEMIEKYKEYPTFVVMDEIFQSTNPIEGISGGYAVLKQILRYKKHLALITTHYTAITKFKKTLPIKNFKFEAVVNENENTIDYDYKIKDGISKQYIALDILKKEGFPINLIQNANKMKKKLCKKGKY